MSLFVQAVGVEVILKEYIFIGKYKKLLLYLAYSTTPGPSLAFDPN